MESNEDTFPHEAELLQMLTYCRPHDTDTEREFVERFITPTGALPVRTTTGLIAAYEVDIPHPDGSRCRTLFSAHVDTVHHMGGRQIVTHDPFMGLVYVDKDASCLGADDGAGVWLLLRMIEAKVPGTYLFHRGEERGGIGSSAMSRDPHISERLRGYDHAIAFDRRGTSDLITHQRGGTRGCSDAFANELCARLNGGGLSYAPCDGGTFTDTANYFQLIPECINLSVGYEMEHTSNETLDLQHLYALALVACDPRTWADLPVKRDPVVIEARPAWGRYIGHHHAYADYGGYDEWDFSPQDKSKDVSQVPAVRFVSGEELAEMPLKELLQFLKDATYTEIADAINDLADLYYKAIDDLDMLYEEMAEEEDNDDEERQLHVVN